MIQCKVKLDIFEGPLDLLLYLVKKSEVDIYHIPIVEITDQYLKYLDLMKTLDLEIAGEFLWMAANLIYLKSKMLLPIEQQEEEEEDEEFDPHSELIRQLIEYKKFKEAADGLKKMEEARSLYFPREATPEMDSHDFAADLGEVSIFDLLNAFSKILEKVQIRENLNKLFEEEVSVEGKILMIEEMLSSRFSFVLEDFFSGNVSRMELVATFLAVLELIRLKRIRVTQDNNFGNIFVQRAVDIKQLEARG